MQPASRALLLAALALLGGCAQIIGIEDLPAVDPATDAAAPDAGVAILDAGDELDAPTEARAGSIFITELAVTNDGVDQSGAEVSIEYVDPGQATVPAFPDGATEPLLRPAQGSCAVWVYDAGSSEVEPAVVDEGAVTITDALSPIDTCALDGDAYACKYLEGTVPEGTTVNGGSKEVDFGVETFADLEIDGMFVKLDGFAQTGNNGTFPIVDYDDTSMTVDNPEAASEFVQAGSEPTYTIFAGAGPTGASKPFLDEDSTVIVSKAAGAEVAAFSDVMIPAAGDGLALRPDSAQPHALNTASDKTFFCSDGTGQTCGNTPAGAMVQFMIVGRTTNADISEAGPTEMPAPTGQYAVFQCRSQFDASTITLPQSALQVIFGTNPSRVETKFLRVTYQTQDDPDNAGATTDILVGHGLVGYTDPL